MKRNGAMFGWFKECEEDKKLREEVVKYFQPSMRVVSGGGGWCLVMNPEEGRRTARNKSDDDED